MAAGGSISAMIASLRNNSRMLHRKGKFKKQSAFLKGQVEFLKAAQGQLELRKASKAQLKKIREDISQNRRIERRNYFLCGIAAFLLLVLFYKVTATFLSPQNLNPHKMSIAETLFIDQTEKQKTDYQFFISEGDKYIIEEHWHNAIFQYSKALEIYPHEFDANYRLALAYSYSCVQSQKRCEKAKYLVQKIESKFPENKKISALKLSLGKHAF